jgi:hypothetical protein
MTILDNYLRAVRCYLPQAQKDDIIQELSENIRSQVEDKESELGRPLNDVEMQAILKGHGHPLVVAGRYRQDEGSFTFGKQLIGPALFPFYTKVLSFNLGVTSIVILIIFTALIAGGQPVSLLNGLPSVFFYQLTIQFGVITLIFATVDRQVSKFPDRWDPWLSKQTFYPNFEGEPDAPRVPRPQSLSTLIALPLLIVWLRLIQQTPFLILGPAAAFLKLAPIWHHLYFPVVLLALVGMLQAGINLIRPDWVKLQSMTKIGIDAATVAMWIYLLNAGQWVVAGSQNSPMVGPATLETINRFFSYGLVLAVVISAIQLLLRIRRFAGGKQKPSTPTV